MSYDAKGADGNTITMESTVNGDGNHVQHFTPDYQRVKVWKNDKNLAARPLTLTIAPRPSNPKNYTALVGIYWTEQATGTLGPVDLRNDDVILIQIQDVDGNIYQQLLDHPRQSQAQALAAGKQAYDDTIDRYMIRFAFPIPTIKPNREFQVAWAVQDSGQNIVPRLFGVGAQYHGYYIELEA